MHRPRYRVPHWWKQSGCICPKNSYSTVRSTSADYFFAIWRANIFVCFDLCCTTFFNSSPENGGQGNCICRTILGVRLICREAEMFWVLEYIRPQMAFQSAVLLISIYLPSPVNLIVLPCLQLYTRNVTKNNRSFVNVLLQFSVGVVWELQLRWGLMIQCISVFPVWNIMVNNSLQKQITKVIVWGKVLLKHNHTLNRWHSTIRTNEDCGNKVITFYLLSFNSKRII